MTTERTPILCSSLLNAHGFAHAFTTRLGGVSEGPFASLNFGRVLGDRVEHVEENHRRLADAVGYAVAKLYETSQVHGAHIVDVAAMDDVVQTRTIEADALVTRAESVAVAVRTADCLPVLLAHPQSGSVAAVHAGWRGAAAGIVSRTVARLEAQGCPRAEIVAAIGPHIRACCFEVGDEVIAALNASSGTDVRRRGRSEQPHADLSAAVRAQLANAGVTQLDEVIACTHCDTHRFHSFRRDGKQSGRLLSVIVARSSAQESA